MTNVQSLPASGLPPSGTPFFLPAARGQRLCIWHAPDAGVVLHEAIVYVHPFGDEMHKSRRMAALQARALAAAGMAVLQIDLFGCGDSSGDFADARWEIWLADLALAHAWLARRTAVPISLWGLRLGALLALDYAKNCTAHLSRLVLWQPILHGEAYMTQFLRLKLASEILGGTTSTPDQPAAVSGTRGLRAAMHNGETLEVAGYELTPDLASVIDTVNATDLAPHGRAVEWFEVVPSADRPLSPASQRLTAEWQHAGIGMRTWCVTGSPFWSTQEIVECAALLACTTEALCLQP